MADKRTIAIIVGASVGVAAVAAAVGFYVSRHHEPAVKDVNEVFDEARRTLQKLDKAVEALRHSVT